MASRSRTNSDASTIDILGPPTTDETIEYDTNDYFDNAMGLENIRLYNKGGYHPVHLDDVIDGRFKVYHKLGNGGFGLVWLCRDIVLGKWRALKIMAANHAGEKEQKILNHLRDRCTPEELEENHIMMPLEEFWIEGVNGRHLCFVMPIYGWAVSNWRNRQRGYHPGTNAKARDVCQQIIKSLYFLHSHGICHGDFNPRNILMKVEGIDEMSEEEILNRIDEPDCYNIYTVSGQSPGPGARAPKYQVQPLDGYWCKDLTVKSKSIAVIDFGESFFMDSPPKTTGIPNLYAPPEVLFEGTGTPGPYSDIWALACTLFEVRTSDQLFPPPEFGGGHGLPVDEMESYLGPLPEIYITAFFEMLRKARERQMAPIQRAEPLSIKSENSIKREPDQKPELEAKQEPELEPERQSEPEQQSEQEESSESEREDQCPDKFERVLGSERQALRSLQPPEDLPADQESSEFISWWYPREEVLELADLLRKMMRYDPAERIDIEAVASHPWARGLE
ncbi:hypothetical protein Hte_006081 [Hypoxylon texense]